MTALIDQSAKVVNSELGEDVKVFRHAELVDSKLGDRSIIGDESIVRKSAIESNISINRRNFILRSSLGRFSYTGIGTSLWSAQVGRFCSISWNVSIGGANHDYSKVSNSSLNRFYSLDTGNLDQGANKALMSRLQELEPCVVGNDVWIATNAIVLNGVTVGNGAVIGAGAVVTENVEPYSVVVGVPGRSVKKRFASPIVDALQTIAWWDWPIEKIRENLSLIYSTKVDERVIDDLKTISLEIQTG